MKRTCRLGGDAQYFWYGAVRINAIEVFIMDNAFFLGVIVRVPTV